MKEAVREIWTENKNLPGFFVAKMIIVLAMLFMPLFAPNAPFEIGFFFVLVSIDRMYSINRAPQADFFIPRSVKQFQHEKWCKAVGKGGFYASVMTLSYIILVFANERYSWTQEMVLVLVLNAILGFLFCVGSQLTFECARYGCKNASQIQETKDAVVIGIKNFFGASYMVFSIFVVFTNEKYGFIKVLSLQKSRMAELVLYVAIVFLVVVGIKKDITELKPEEYRELSEEE